MWYKIYADGSEIDIIHAQSPKEAIQIAKNRYGEDAVWSWSLYG
jgi:hypothetical protein